MMIELRDLAHIPWAIGIQLAGVGLFSTVESIKPRHWWICGCGGIAAVASREVAQAEYRYIEAHGHLRANMPDLEGFNIAAWNRHSLAETLVAAAAVVVLSVTASAVIRHRRK